MQVFKQFIAISHMSLASLHQRTSTSLVVVIGIGGVVAVLVSLLAMINGFSQAMSNTGDDNRVLILRAGSNSELNGSISAEHANIIRLLPGIARLEDQPLAAFETYVGASLPKKETGEFANVPLRGISEASIQVRPEITIIAGRLPQSGRRELLVGRAVVEQFANLDLGSEIVLRNSTWNVVGIFTSKGSASESELWADVFSVNRIYQREGGFSSILVRLENTAALNRLQDSIAGDQRLNVQLLRESDYYATQSKTTVMLMERVGAVIAVIMSLGAVFAALNTVYATVASRMTEIATLRALGFSSLPVVLSVIVEALLLAFTGGVLGATFAYVGFDNLNASTVSGVYAQVAFQLDVTVKIMVIGILLALALGFIGGLFPALRAARLPITEALKA